MTDVPVIIKLPFPCPHCGEEVREDVGRLITNRQAVCSFCGLTIDLGRGQMSQLQNWVGAVNYWDLRADFFEVSAIHFGSVFP